MKFQYRVVTNTDEKAPKTQEIDLDPTSQVRIRTSRGTTYAPLPENEGDLLEILLVEPLAEPEVTPVAETTGKSAKS